MSDSRLLRQPGYCELMPGYEVPAPLPSKLKGIKGLSLYQTKERYRLVYEGVTALTINKATKTIEHLYTAPEQRGQGLARSIIGAGRLLVPGLKHSDYLTIEGQRLVG